MCGCRWARHGLQSKRREENRVDREKKARTRVSPNGPKKAKDTCVAVAVDIRGRVKECEEEGGGRRRRREGDGEEEEVRYQGTCIMTTSHGVLLRSTAFKSFSTKLAHASLGVSYTYMHT